MGCCCSKKKDAKKQEVTQSPKVEPKPATVEKKPVVKPPEVKTPEKPEEPKKKVVVEEEEKKPQPVSTPAPLEKTQDIEMTSEKTTFDELPDDEVNTAMAKFVKETVKKGISGLVKEFEQLKADKPGPHEAFKKNLPKNRYPTTIPCLDETRVILKHNVPPETDYIHANWVKHIELKNTFVCTQGPMQNTVSDFWRMIWDVKPTTIVMLVQQTENDRVKCHKYWPDEEGEQVQHHRIKIVNYGDEEKNSETAFHMKKIKYRIDDDIHFLKFIRYTDWPEAGLPRSGMGLWRILRKLDLEKGTVVVHCCSGVGRTAMLVAAGICTRILLSGNYVKMKDIVEELRTIRYGMIQSPGQYVHLHYVICTFIETKIADNVDMSRTLERLRQFEQEYQKFANAEELEDKKRIPKKKRLKNETPKDKN